MTNENNEKEAKHSNVTAEWLQDFFIGVRIGNTVYSHPRTFIRKTTTETVKNDGDKNG